MKNGRKEPEEKDESSDNVSLSPPGGGERRTVVGNLVLCE